jgi:hypothetical protein
VKRIAKRAPPRPARTGEELRAELIAAGVIVPPSRDGLTPVRLDPSRSVLRLDDAAQIALVREFRSNAWRYE